jgi:hypothetical protein
VISSNLLENPAVQGQTAERGAAVKVYWSG